MVVEIKGVVVVVVAGEVEVVMVVLDSVFVGIVAGSVGGTVIKGGH